MPQPTDLPGQLKAERRQYDRLVVQAQQLESEIRTLEDNLVRLQDADTETLLSDTYPGKLQAAQQAVTAARARGHALQVVVSRQHAVVEGLEGRIQGGKRDRFIEAVTPLQAQMWADFERFLTSASAVAEVCTQFHDVAEMFQVFRPMDAADPGNHHIERQQAMGIYIAAVQHFRFRQMSRLEGYRWKAV